MPIVDESIVQIQEATAIADADLMLVVQNVSTMPVTRSKTGTLVKAWLKTYFDTLYASITGFAANIAFSSFISPTQITADQNDYNPTGLSTAAVLRLSSNASRNITGLAGGAAGRILILHNVGSQNVVLKDESGSSAAANRFALPNDLILLPDMSTALQYDATSSRWRAFGNADITTTLLSGVKLTYNSATSIDVGTGRCYAQNGDLIDITSAITKSSLSLSASTFNHVYVFLNSGAPAAEVVTTAPVIWKGTAYSKTGDTSRRYVGSILTDGSGNVYEFLHNPTSNLMVYKNVSAAAAPFRCLSSGTATTATAVALSGVVPVTARFAKVRMFNSGTQAAYANESSAVSTAIYFVGILAVATQNQVDNFPINSSQQLFYLVTAGGNLSVDILGYSFDR